LRCLEKDEFEKVLTQLHSGSAGGHFGGDTIAHKVIRDWYTIGQHCLEMLIPSLVSVKFVKRKQTE
jgi:hypothetical protein